MRLKFRQENKYFLFQTDKDLTVKELIKILKANKHLNLKNEEILILDEAQRILEEDELIKNQPNFKTSDDSMKIDNLINKDEKINGIERELFIHTFKKLGNNKYNSSQDFFDIKNSKLTENKNKLNQITELIQKTTNAKEKLNVLELNKPIHKSVDRFRIFEDLLSNNLGGLIGQRSSGPLASQANQINELLSILRPMIDNDMQVESTTSNLGNVRQQNVSTSTNSSNTIFRPFRINAQPVNADENLLNSLKEMGFPEEQCRRALIQARNDISRATDLLLSDGLDYLPSENANNNNNNNRK